MELYLVKEQVKITDAYETVYAERIPVNWIKRLLSCGQDCDEDDSQEDRYGGEYCLHVKSDFPVALESICTEKASENTEKFTKRLESLFLTESSNRFENMALELLIPYDPNLMESSDGYFLLSGVWTDRSKMNFLKRLKEFQKDFGVNDSQVKFTVEVSLGHLATEDAAVSPDCLTNWKAEEMDFQQIRGNRILCRKPVRVPGEFQRDWRYCMGGFIYAKLSVKVAFTAEAVDRFCKGLNVNEKLLQDVNLGDLVIHCKTGEKIKCHRALVAAKSKKIEKKLKGESEPWKLEMEMSKEGVEAFLGYIYYGYVSYGLGCAHVALELLKVGQEYGVSGLWEEVVKIIRMKASTDFHFFSKKGALALFLYARNDKEKKPLKDKAVRVLRNYLKTDGDRELGRRTAMYEERFQNRLKVNLELSTLYLKL